MNLDFFTILNLVLWVCWLLLFILVIFLFVDRRKTQLKTRDAINLKYQTVLKMAEALNNSVGNTIKVHAEYYHLLWEVERISTNDLSNELDRQINFLREEGVVPINQIEG